MNLPLSYSWKVLSYPSGSTFQWISETTATPIIHPDIIGDYVIQLTVTDARMTPGEPDTMNIAVRTNQLHSRSKRPYAGKEGQAPVTFSAVGSNDPEGATLQYRWDFNGDGNYDTGWQTTPTLLTAGTIIIQAP